MKIWYDNTDNIKNITKTTIIKLKIKDFKVGVR